MQIKVRNKIYDGKNEPVMIIFSEGERKQIANMSPGTTKYCIYPSKEKWTKDNYKKINQWMRDVKETENREK